METEVHLNGAFLTETNDSNYNERKLFLVKQYLKKERAKKPFDGMATNRKKLTIRDFIHEQDNPYEKGKNSLFEEHFPLLNVISNRNALNFSKYFLTDMLSDPILSQTAENIISSKSYKQPIKINQNRFQNAKIDNVLHNVLKKKTNSFEKNVSIQTGKSTNRNDINTLSHFFSDSYRKLKDNYKKYNLKFHRINGENQENMKIKNDDNYILNGYKNRKKDEFLDLLRNEATKLKYNQSLRLCSNLI